MDVQPLDIRSFPGALQLIQAKLREAEQDVVDRDTTNTKRQVVAKFSINPEADGSVHIEFTVGIKIPPLKTEACGTLQSHMGKERIIAARVQLDLVELLEQVGGRNKEPLGDAIEAAARKLEREGVNVSDSG